jgi:uncharacterized protein (DUF1778 family)
MSRTALLIRCATTDAERIRTEAERERRTISSYVLGVAARAVELEDRLYAKMSMHSDFNRIVSRRGHIDPVSRTAILVRCEDVEAERIREAARRRNVPINSFVLQSLKRAWIVQTMPLATDTGNAALPHAG